VLYYFYIVIVTSKKIYINEDFNLDTFGVTIEIFFGDFSKFGMGQSPIPNLQGNKLGHPCVYKMKFVGVIGDII